MSARKPVDVRPEAAVNLGRVTRNELERGRWDVRYAIRRITDEQDRLRSEEARLREEHVRLTRLIEDWDDALAAAGVPEKERGR